MRNSDCETYQIDNSFLLNESLENRFFLLCEFVHSDIWHIDPNLET